jgi:hypothetical protein
MTADIVKLADYRLKSRVSGHPSFPAFGVASVLGGFSCNPPAAARPYDPENLSEVLRYLAAGGPSRDIPPDPAA